MDEPGTARPGTARPGTARPELDRVRRLIGGPETAWLLDRVRRQLEATGEVRGTVTRQQATSAERIAVARLLGRPVRPGSTASVPLDQLDAALRRGPWPDGLASAVIALTGPVADPELRRSERESWQRATEQFRALGESVPRLAGWVQTGVRAGLLKRAASDPETASRLVAQLTDVAAALPAENELLGVLAVTLFGDAHALDAKTPLGSLAVGLAAALGGVPPGSGSHWRRDAWQSVDVTVDELSSAVLVLALPGGDDSPTARALSVLAAAGQPALLTYRQLAGDAIGAVPRVVHVCENPAVVAAAAERLGAASAPLVCLAGQPGAAASRLLRLLADGGAELRYHGDFDAGGMAIARTLARRVEWVPWRFCVADYERGLSASDELTPFTGAVGATPWEEGLSDVLEHRRLRLEEETVLATLLDDLARVHD